MCNFPGDHGCIESACAADTASALPGRPNGYSTLPFKQMFAASTSCSV